MQKEIRARLDSLPKTEASFVEPMECLSVSKLPEGLEWLWEFYVVRHIMSLLWRSALCGAEDAGQLRRRTEPPPTPHNSHQRPGLGEVPV